MRKIVTIGVYGFTEEAFFAALPAAGIDTFCDVRRRRGVRGREYAFANSQRLQQRIGELGIRYLHFLELAPAPAVRQLQAAADKAEKVARRKREGLSQAFMEAYQKGVLADFDAAAFVESLGPEAEVVALFCVERLPEACHRSLVANHLQQALGVAVEHIIP